MHEITEAKGRARRVAPPHAPMQDEYASHTAEIYCAKTYFTSFPPILQGGEIGVCVASAV